MRRVIDGESVELMTKEDHFKKCKCDKYVEFSKKNDMKIVILYRKCLKCGACIEGEIYNLREDYY